MFCGSNSVLKRVHHFQRWHTVFAAGKFIFSPDPMLAGAGPNHRTVSQLRTYLLGAKGWHLVCAEGGDGKWQHARRLRHKHERAAYQGIG
jgi:hypothetical protein